MNRSVLTCLIAVNVLVARQMPANSEEPIFPNPSALKELWNGGEFTEGVAVRADGQVFFSDIPKDPQKAGRILQYDPNSGRTTVFCADSRKSNGLYFTADGRLLACCGANGGAMALCEVTSEGTVKPLVERFQGKRFNAPNDLVVHPNGFVYFSDPRYLGPEPLELEHQSVYRYHLKTGALERATTDIEKPNGVHTSPDGKTLYIAETNNGSTGQNPNAAPTPGRMTLNAFDVAADGTLSHKRVLVDFGTALGTDGMSINRRGNIFAAVRSADRFGIVVYEPTGREIAYLPTPDLPTNCCFGTGDRRSVLYITVGGGLFEVSVSSNAGN